VAETLYCYRHPKRETRVSCAACGRPICTECMTQTAVGIKCPEDARLPRGARVGVMKPSQILRTLLAGTGVALVGIPVVSIILGLPFQLLISAVVGYGAGTLINRAGGRNGGPLAITASVVATAIPFLVWLVPNALAGYFPTFNVLAAILAAVAAGLANRRS
jgi:DDE_Tnp_1-like zinc-ribbon